MIFIYHFLRIFTFTGILLLWLSPRINAEALSQEYIQNLFTQEEKTIDLNASLALITKSASKDLLKEEMFVSDFNKHLTQMEKDLRRLLPDKAPPKQQIKMINQYLYGQKGFSPDRSKLFESTLETLLLNRVLQNTKGHCLSLSLIYLCLAERLDLPVNGVMVPNHFFVRYDNGHQRINVETTYNGKNFPDLYYRKYYLKGFDDKVSLKKLTKKETLAIYLSNLANHYKLQGNHKKAMQMFLQIMKVLPGRASLYTNLGNTYERDKQIAKAIAIYQHSLSLNPYLCQTHYNLGLAHFYYTKIYDQARKHGEFARKLGCRMHPEFESFLKRGKL